MTHLLNPDAIADLNQFTLRKLARTLVSSQGKFAWIWIQCNSLPLQEQILQDLKDLCPIKWRKLNLVSSVIDLQENINKIITHQNPSALMITGLDSLDDIYSFFRNLDHNEFSQNFPFPIMIWITDEMNEVLRQYAPQIRHNSAEPFRFDGIPIPATVQGNNQYNSNYSSKAYSNQGSFEAKIKKLSQGKPEENTFAQNNITSSFYSQEKQLRVTSQSSSKRRSRLPNMPSLPQLIDFTSTQTTNYQPYNNNRNINNFNTSQERETTNYQSSNNHRNTNTFNPSQEFVATPKTKKYPLTAINQSYKIFIFEPDYNDEITEVIDALRAEVSVLINFSNMSSEDARRSLDFLSGGTFAIDGDQTKVGEQIFLFTPNCVHLSINID